MKLLLTSAGITKKCIAQALQELTGKAPGECKVAFVPTALNAEPGNKDWVTRQILDLWRSGYYWVDIVDPSAADIDWQSRLAEADIIYVCGGNTFYLLDQSRKTGYGDWLNRNLGGKVYVGGSASSIIATPTIEVASLEPGDENVPGITDLTGYGWVGFEIEPHCTQERFVAVEQYAKGRSHPVYAIDDLTAIKVDGDKVEVVSEGSWKRYDPAPEAA